MERYPYKSMNTRFHVSRRDFLKTGSIVGAGLLLGTPTLWADDTESRVAPEKPKTNIKDALKTPRTEFSLPGRFPGKVVQVHDETAMTDQGVNQEALDGMFEKGLTSLTGADPAKSFDKLFTKDDIVGIKVNPVGAGLISTRLELVDAIIAWLVANGLKKENIIIWDRFDYMLTDAGFTAERYPGIGIEGLQTSDEAAMMGTAEDDSGWLSEDGVHLSFDNFDQDYFYWADVKGPDDKQYLNQHVVADEHSYFGKLLTQKLTKIINVPVFKNTGNGISVATKNLGYGAICNTGRLHRPLFFDVCTEVLAFSAIRDKLVLNITDGLRAQYDGGPMPAADFTYLYNTLFFATDPFALDFVSQGIMVEKRKSMQIKVNEHPMFTDYLRYGEELGIGIATPEKIEHIQA